MWDLGDERHCLRATLRELCLQRRGSQNFRKRVIKRERVKNASIKAYMRAFIHCQTQLSFKDV